MGKAQPRAGHDPVPGDDLPSGQPVQPVIIRNGTGEFMRNLIQILSLLAIVAGGILWISSTKDNMVSREELKLLVLERLDVLATKEQVQMLTQRLDRMENRLDARLKALENK